MQASDLSAQTAGEARVEVSAICTNALHCLVYSLISPIIRRLTHPKP